MDSRNTSGKILAAVIDPALQSAGYVLLRIGVTPGGRYQTLHITAEREDGKPMTVQDCVAVSREASRSLEIGGFSGEKFTLEISSPGESGALVRVEEADREKSGRAFVDLRPPSGEKQNFKGSIERISKREKADESALGGQARKAETDVKGTGKTKDRPSDGLPVGEQ